jgi:hypothetical protein
MGRGQTPGPFLFRRAIMSMDEYVKVRVHKSTLGDILKHRCDVKGFLKEINITEDNFYTFPYEVRKAYLRYSEVSSALLGRVLREDKSSDVLYDVAHRYFFIPIDKNFDKRRGVFKEACASLEPKNFDRMFRTMIYPAAIRQAIFCSLPLKVLPLYIGRSKDLDFIIEKRIREGV